MKVHSNPPPLACCKSRVNCQPDGVGVEASTSTSSIRASSNLASTSRNPLGHSPVRLLLIGHQNLHQRLSRWAERRALPPHRMALLSLTWLGRQGKWAGCTTHRIASHHIKQRSQRSGISTRGRKVTSYRHLVMRRSSSSGHSISRSWAFLFCGRRLELGHECSLRVSPMAFPGRCTMPSSDHYHLLIDRLMTQNSKKKSPNPPCNLT
ncbi:hypothetical protein DL95DRAFT_70457 [Leptodontidium sp. 2 PMI_412]|nr:hypothetical protein DL95DRAFT_70457 [Leptodontidium sp. 2 PMI_412]